MAKHELIDKYFPVLDHGFIALKDYMGGDDSIEESARVSYRKGTRKISDSKSLIRFLMRHNHGTPLESVEFRFHVGLPIFVCREWHRHRISSFSEFSARFSEMPMIFYSPEDHRFAKQSTTNKQGTSDEVINEDKIELHKAIINNQRGALSSHYREMLGEGIAREVARVNLPVGIYTYMYYKTNLRSLFNFMVLRTNPKAQWEIRQFAGIICGIVQQICPLAFEGWYDYQFANANMSRMEMNALREMLKGCDEPTDEFLSHFDIGVREAEEFRAKLAVPSLRDFTLDLFAAKTPEYFEEMIKNSN